MHAIANTEKLVTDGVISPSQAAAIEVRARDAMVTLAINAVLFFGILAATGGLIFWLADAVAVAISGFLALAGGLLILMRGGDMLRMFGNASALIGAGLLIGGASLELIDKYEGVAGWAMAGGGAVIVVLAGRAMLFGGLTARFVAGAILLMGVATHLGGLGYLLAEAGRDGIVVSLFYLYCTAAIAAVGWITDVRLITALAIVPFAQALDTGTFYFHAAYVFHSPEPTLSILQMAALIALGLWVSARLDDRDQRHIGVVLVMAFVVANLCALVASLWGDTVGETLWGPDWLDDMTWEEWDAARDLFRESTLHISANVYAVLWAIALATMIGWAAHKKLRGLFNTALTFAAIHAYTQMFETFGDEPLAFVIGGLAAIPLAWGMWRLNHWIVAREGDDTPSSAAGS